MKLKIEFERYKKRKKYFDSKYIINPFTESSEGKVYVVGIRKPQNETNVGEIEITPHKLESQKNNDDIQLETSPSSNLEKSSRKKTRPEPKLSHELFTNDVNYKAVYSKGIKEYDSSESNKRFEEIKKAEKYKNRINLVLIIIGLIITTSFMFFIYPFLESMWFLGLILFVLCIYSIIFLFFKNQKRFDSFIDNELKYLRSQKNNLFSKNKEYLENIFELGKQRDSVMSSLYNHERWVFEKDKEILTLDVEIETLNKKISSKESELESVLNDSTLQLDDEKDKERKAAVGLINKHKKKITELKIEKQKIETRYQKIFNNMKSEENERLKRLQEKFLEYTKQEMEDYKEETRNKMEKEILENTFTKDNKPFNKSKEISHEEYLRKKRKEEDEQKREREKLEMDKELLKMSQNILGLKDEMVNEKMSQGEKHLEHKRDRIDMKLDQGKKHLQHNKERAEMKSEFSQKLSKLEILIIKGLANLDVKIETGLSKLEKSISEVKTWAEINFNTMKMWVKEEILRIDENQMKIVNKMEEFEIRYKGDMRDIQQQFKENDLRIDRVAFDAHERLLALDYNIKNEGLRLDKKIDSEVLRLEKSDMANEGLLVNIQHNLEKGLLCTKMEQRESEYRSDSRMRDLRSDTEKSFHNSKMEQRESEYRSDSRMRDLENSTERNILEARFDNERKIFVFDKKLDKRLDYLAHTHKLELKDINHLAEIKGQKLENIVSQKVSNIREQISEEKANNKTQWAKMDAKYSIQISDMKTLHMKHLYEQDKKIMSVINKIESLHNDISKTSIRMDSMKNEIQRIGLANDKIKQDAQILLRQVSLRLESIDNGLKLAKETSRLVEERIETKVNSDLMKLKSISLDQERKLQEIAFAEQGMNSLISGYENRATKKELETKSMNNKMELLDKKIAIEKRFISETGRLQNREIGMNNKLTNLIDEKNDWKRDAEQSNRDANYYRKAAEHFQKKARY